MSSHCSRYPHCGCPGDYGIKCHLPSEMVPLDKEAYSDPLPVTKEDIADFDIEAAKRADEEKYNRIERGGKNRAPHQKYPSNYTKPKRRKKK